MISICIPIFNFDVNSLVQELVRQMNSVAVSCELVLIDDCSSDDFRNINQKVCEQHKYILLPENIGRARIRNLFLSHTTFNYLLFLDCDSLVVSPDFLMNYIESIEKESLVVCGGRVYPDARPDENHLLRWTYGLERECQSAKVRQMNPNKSFMTNNFLIHRSLFQRIPFDETLAGYGHEDTLLGYYLKLNGIEITHIENPVLNGDVEDNALFLLKTEQGVENLCKIAQKLDFEPGFVNDIDLLKAFVKLKKYKIRPLFNLCFSCWKTFLKSKLIKGNCNMFVLNVYKLGLFSKFCK